MQFSVLLFLASGIYNGEQRGKLWINFTNTLCKDLESFYTCIIDDVFGAQLMAKGA